MKIFLRILQIVASVLLLLGVGVLIVGMKIGDQGVINVGIVIPLLCVLMFLLLGKQKKIVKAQQLGEGEIRFGGLISKTTFSDIPVGVACQVSLIGETIALKAGSRSFSIQKSQILGADTYGARTNAAGIVITGITGVDSKQKTTQHFYTYISFKSATGETNQIDLEVYPPMRQVNLFNKEVASGLTETIVL